MILKNEHKLRKAIERARKSMLAILNIRIDGTWQISDAVDPDGWGWLLVGHGLTAKDAVFFTENDFLNTI